MNVSTALTERETLRQVILRLLTQDQPDPVNAAAQRALLIYAQCNKMLGYARQRVQSGDCSCQPMETRARQARALALASLDEINQAKFFPFMAHPTFTCAEDQADDYAEMLSTVNAWLDQALNWFLEHDAPLDEFGSVSPLEEFSQTLVDILCARIGLAWCNQQCPA